MVLTHVATKKKKNNKKILNLNLLMTGRQHWPVRDRGLLPSFGSAINQVLVKKSGHADFNIRVYTDTKKNTYLYIICY